MNIAHALPSDLTSSRGISGMFNTWLDLAESILTGGAGTAKKIVNMTGKKLALEAAKKMLKKLKKLQDELEKKGGGVEVYRSSRETRGCELSMAVFWNKVSGLYKFVILGDCNCGKFEKVYLGRWSVTGKGKAKWRNGRITDLRIYTSKNPKKGLKVHGYCCGKKGNRITYTRNDNPWDIKTNVPGKSPKPKPTKSQEAKAPTKAENQLPETNNGTGEGIADMPNVSNDIPVIPSGPVTVEEKEEWIEKAGAAYAGAKEIFADKQANLDRSIGDNAFESQITQARLDLEAARETLKKAETALDAAYQLKVKTEGDEQSSNFEEENGEGENISLYQCTAERLEGSVEEYQTRFYDEDRWSCNDDDNDCETFSRSEAAESIELYLNNIVAGEWDARKKLSGHINEPAYNFILKKHGLYDYHIKMLCQSLEDLKERCAISRRDLDEFRQGTQEVMSRHFYIMRVLKYSKRNPRRTNNISDQSKRANERYFESLSICDTC